MKKNLFQALMPFVFVFFSSVAFAEIPVNSAELLMKETRMDVALDVVAGQLYKEIESTAADAKMTPELLEKLKSLVTKCYAEDVLRKEVASKIASNVSSDDFQTVMRWYRGPLAKKISMVEAKYDDEALRKGVAVMGPIDAKTLKQSSPRRQILMANLLAASRLVEFSVNLQIFMSMGMYQGIASVAPGPAATNISDFKEMLEKYRPQMQAAFSESHLASFAGTYVKLSDEELVRYAAFFNGLAGSHVRDAMLQAMEYALVRASSEMGKGLLPAPGSDTTSL